VFNETRVELNKRLTYECRCDERLKSKDQRSTRIHVYIHTIGAPSKFRVIRKTSDLVRMLPHFDLRMLFIMNR
jgi:hypothetical protein